MNEHEERMREQRKQKIRKKAYRRHKRKEKLKKTFLLLGLMGILVAGGILGVNLLQDQEGTLQYSYKNQFGNEILSASNNHQQAGVAKNLCVTDNNVDLEGVRMEDSQTACLMDLNHQNVKYAQNIYQRIYPASITKIMTALLAMKYGDMDSKVTITQENLNLEEGSQVCGFYPGDELTLEQLLHFLLIYSGNDAAAAIATHIGGTEEEFVNMMNEYAWELGMTGTHFDNPHGLHQDTHYTTVYDIYLMLQEAYKYSIFTEISQLSSYTATFTRADGSETSLTLDATDYYLIGAATPPKNVTVLGGKTGTTDQAGNCLALITQNAYGDPFISIVLNAIDKPTLYDEMNSLLEQINEA